MAVLVWVLILVFGTECLEGSTQPLSPVEVDAVYTWVDTRWVSEHVVLPLHATLHAWGAYSYSLLSSSKAHTVLHAVNALQHIPYSDAKWANAKQVYRSQKASPTQSLDNAGKCVVSNTGTGIWLLCSAF
jgi:hypothetical protein